MDLRCALSTLALVVSLVVATNLPAAFAKEQKGPFADLQAQIDALQAQINALTVPEADAITGTWSGTLMALTLNQFSGPLFSVNSPTPQPVLTNSFTFPVVADPNAQQLIFNPFTVSVNLDLAGGFARAHSEMSPITLILTRDGTALSGTATSGGGTVTVVGAVVSSNFFLLKAIAPDTGACSPGRFQGVASFSSIDPNRLIITGSGIEAGCSYTLFTINLVRQP